ncbi:MAG: hypothetical protein JO142_09570 [Burkholderiales bacterium]|nr:hypothetical protein [Burkholderiales bacterium]
MLKSITFSLVLGIATHAAATEQLQYFADPEAKRLADSSYSYITTKKVIEPGRTSISQAAALHGHPDAMLDRCKVFETPRTSLADHAKSLAWCRVAAAVLPDAAQQQRDEAKRILSTAPADLPPAYGKLVSLFEQRFHRRVFEPFQPASRPDAQAASLPYATDPEATGAADALMRSAESLPYAEGARAIERAAMIGHPHAMMAQCQQANPETPPAFAAGFEKGIVWCRTLVAKVASSPATDTYRETAKRYLDLDAPRLVGFVAKEVERQEKLIGFELNRRWQLRERDVAEATEEAPLIAAAEKEKRQRDIEAIDSRAGAPTAEAAIDAYLVAVKSHDAAAFQRIVDPLDTVADEPFGPQELQYWLHCDYDVPGATQDISATQAPNAPRPEFPHRIARINERCGEDQAYRSSSIEVLQIRSKWFVMPNRMAYGMRLLMQYDAHLRTQ